MKPATNLIFDENPFSLRSNEVNTTTVSDPSVFRTGSQSMYSPALQAMLEKPVNNYLKSQEEMEREFCFVINSREDGATLSINTDGYINIHNPGEKFSGYMEENY